jgi:replicative DNA helicase
MTTHSPPFNSQAERGILGCMLLEPEQIPELAARLEPEDFYGDNHQRVFRLLVQMHGRGEGVDLTTVVQRVRDLGMTDDVGGVHYLAGLGDNVPAPALLRHYRDLVIRHASARSLLTMGNEIGALAATGDADSLAQAEALLARGPEALQRLQAREVVHASEVVGDVQADLYAIAEGSRAVYVETGLPEWDIAPDFGGLSAEGVTLIIAASGMGKTTVLNSLAVSCAASGRHTYIHGTETSGKRRISDMAAALANVDRRAWVQWQRGNAEDRDRLWGEVNRMDEALRYIAGLPLMVTGAGLTVEQVCSRARNLRRAGRCDVMFADYLQDFRRSTGDGLRSDRGAQTDHASTTLKELAADVTIPVVVGAQVSGEKAGVSPGDKAAAPIPQMYDVQWSSKAHQDAEEVYALYRDDYYRDRFGAEWSPKGDPGVIDVYARKRRTGRLGRLDLDFSVPGKWAGTRPNWRSRA